MTALLARLRDWWHSPVTDRLDAIERNTRPAHVAIEKPELVMSPAGHQELRKRLKQAARSV